jgi:olefin beta-lactone synthetase
VTAPAPATRAQPTGAARPPVLPGLDPAWSRIVDVDGVSWHLLDNAGALGGREPVGTVLAVHGNPTWSYLWRRMLAAGAEAGWRVVAVDQPGMGFSGRDGRRRILPDRVRELGALTAELGLAHPVVTLGHDWGGVVSLGWAVDHPELLAGVAVLNTAVAQPAGSPLPAPLRLALHPAVLAPATRGTPAFLDVTLGLAAPRLDPAVRDAYRAPYLTAGRRAGIRDFVADIPVAGAHPSWDELDRIATGVRGIDVPALALWGPEDPIFSDRYLDDLARRLPQLDVHRFEGAGHLVAEDVDYVAPLLRWLAGFPTASPAASAGRGGAERTAGRGGAERRLETAPAPPSPAPHPLWHALERRAADPADALVELEPGGVRRRIPWRLLARRVDELARGLVELGVRRGDRVSLLVPPGADLTAALYACLRIGAVVVVADAGLGAAGLGRAVRGAQPAWLIGVPRALAAARALGWPGRRIAARRLPAPVAALLDTVADLPDLARAGRGTSAPLPDEPRPDDLAAVLFTSGSTGPAKGVRYTHAGLGALRDRLAGTYGLGDGSALVAGFAPFALLGPALGATTATPAIDVTRPATLTAPLLAAAVAAVSADTVFASPAALANVVATAADLLPDERDALTGVRLLLSAGAPVPLPLLDAVHAILPAAEAHSPYGMTEALLVTDVTRQGIRAGLERTHPDAPRGVCVGAPGDGIEVFIAPLDADGAATGALTAEPGITGEIVVSAPHLLDGYDRLWITDADARRDSAPGLHRHRTSDVGHLDAAGELWVEGRLAHVVVTADGVLTPVGIEQTVETDPAVRRAAAVGVGPHGDQRLVVVVERPGTRIGLAPADLTARLRAAVAAPIAAVLQTPVLPTDIRHRSKIDRVALGAWAGRLLAGERVGAP